MVGVPSTVSLRPSVLARLMPMYIVLNADGIVTALGPTLARLFPAHCPVGRAFFDVMQLRRPSDIKSTTDLVARMGERLHFAPIGVDGVSLRGLAVPSQCGGVLINLSFGIGVIEAVRHHGLTDADFAPTDLAIEMLYLVEAKSVVMAELRNLNQRLQGAKQTAEEQALSDTLTGLRNRRALDATLAGMIARGTDFGLMHIDLDYFKQVNDTHGHAAGDHVLRAVAQVLRAELRVTDTAARVGGDEFVVLLPGLPDIAMLTQIAQRIIEKLTRPIAYEGIQCQISASIGLTVSTNYHPPDAGCMQSDADHALYASKRAGRGQAQFYNAAAPDRQSA